MSLSTKIKVILQGQWGVCGGLLPQLWTEEFSDMSTSLASGKKFISRVLSFPLGCGDIEWQEGLKNGKENKNRSQLQVFSRHK